MEGGGTSRDARPEDENEGWSKSITVYLSAPSGVSRGGGGAREGGGLWALSKGSGRGGRLQRVGGRVALLSKLNGPPLPLLRPQFPH